MTSYTIAAIPTLYRSRMYRSRLEARWAAFFDRLGWTHEYEPFDLGKWSPDFMITDPFDALIEVKPFTEPDPALFERAQNAAPGRTVFITRVAPEDDGDMVNIGWWAPSYMRAFLMWVPDPNRPRLIADFFSATNPPSHWVTCTQGTGLIDEVGANQFLPYKDYTMGLWADACNAVQWEPPA